ncbi:MAG: hypothetical protein M1832_005020 [Thelocarpon impressellum]|nr:MAG: hypothetical protein M1832_005020 [Thelocarpon impressellum]
MQRRGWPADRVPTEIFEYITDFLPRSSIESLRLVCKEFEGKVSLTLFQTVVVPFRPEIYGLIESTHTTASPESKRRKRNNGKGKGTGMLGGEADARDDGPILLKDHGMKVFRGFGHHISQFGMSFEVDEDTLSHPPEKGNQETLETFWGQYKWPFKFYHRYALCAGLEHTADETRSMTVAFSNLERVRELGLSMDNGLGWLNGPDVSERYKILKDKPEVFGRSRLVPDATETARKEAWLAVLKKQMHSRDSSSSEGTQIRRFLSREGINLWPELLQGSLDNAEASTVALTAVQTVILADHQASFPAPGDVSGEEVEPLQGVPPINWAALLDDEEDDDWANWLSEDSEGEEAPAQSAVGAERCKPDSQASSGVTGVSLVPNNLTEAQKEWLLETEWAQRAFLASYTLAIIDNSRTFTSVHALKIARLPSRHLPILRRKDFWASLPSLRDLSLHIIPDWREIYKQGTSFVAATSIEPSTAVVRVNALLRQFIAPVRTIKSLSIGWVGGGEHACGIFARNKHVLAAPIMGKAFDMLEPSRSLLVLELPHVEHLTLSNCWLSPRALVSFVKHLRSKQLHTLKLDSVSLTAPVNPGLANLAHPLPVAAQPTAQANQWPHHIQGIQAVQAHAPHLNHDSDDSDPLDWSQRPRKGSWADFIEELSPGVTLSRIRAERGEDQGGQGPGSNRKSRGLQEMSFVSCGYVRLPLEWNQAAIEPQHMPTIPTSLAKRQADLAPLMMPATDPMLGTIVPYIRVDELVTLREAWGMSQGWPGGMARHDTREDGVPLGGTGRFHGKVTRQRSASGRTASGA